MPYIGEIKPGWEIGLKSSNKHIWAACETCGKERWVCLLRGKPKKKRCVRCQNSSPEKKAKISGSNSCSWKGGRRMTNQGYVRLKLSPSDFFFPMAACDGCVMEHRLIMAQHLGRNLHLWELVHHKNHDRSDNRLENLQLVSDERHKQLTILERKIDKLLEKQEDLKSEVRLLRWELRERVHEQNTEAT